MVFSSHSTKLKVLFAFVALCKKNIAFEILVIGKLGVNVYGEIIVW